MPATNHTYALLSVCLLGACSTVTSRTTISPPATIIEPDNDSHHTSPVLTPEAVNNAATRITSPEDKDTTNIGDTQPLITIPLGEEIAVRAIALVGKPYRYGGADLDGFDCSGLVYFIYHQVGIDVPRTAIAQQHAAAPVSRKELAPGDLLFFKIKRHHVSHVGIYVGDNRFVHAPQSGKLIELRTLDEKYFTRRLASAGRFN